MNDWPKLLAGTYAVVREPIARINDAVLGQPTPCSEWTVRDVFDHVVDTIDMFSRAAGGGTRSAPVAESDPDAAVGTALERFDAAVERNVAAWASLADPSAVLSLSFGDFPAEAAAAINQMDSLIHGWDLAVSLELAPVWPREVAETALRTAEKRFRTRPRGTAFGPEVPAPSDSLQDRLIALSGRDVLPWRSAVSTAGGIRDVYAKLPAQDLERARRFYQETLGLVPFADIHNHLYFDVNGAHFMIFPSTGSPSGTHDQVGLVVDDLLAEVTRLKTAGVCFKRYDIRGVTVRGEIMDTGAMKAAWFMDSEGNLLSLAEFAGTSPFER
ncbi:TIGR03086 family metal-binding protein [Microbacterium sp. STN6]|uniref:TIGR03086 family metal-binding protein n=1 Tax=Microbacterium sp. STN6 TaxID=2995588 RepID=UPI002260ABEA|nr:TIGR03086 family metal-binding protein [Microbacterium sp. STN6]MCX7522224.1 TIGR03086 family metal-binding protein [Microbacterium sp. STN6]